MKVADLIKKLSEFPADMEIVGYESDMERAGIMPYHAYLKKTKVKEVVKETWDRFDGTDYTYKCFVEDPNGDKEVLYLR